jgi:hypothetical protein
MVTQCVFVNCFHWNVDTYLPNYTSSYLKKIVISSHSRQNPKRHKQALNLESFEFSRAVELRIPFFWDKAICVPGSWRFQWTSRPLKIGIPFTHWCTQSSRNDRMYAILFYGLTDQLAEYNGPQYNDGLPVQTWKTTYSATPARYSTWLLTRARPTIFCRGKTVSINIMIVCILALVIRI